MSVLNKQAEKLAKKVSPDNAVLDPTTIFVFVDLISQFIAAFQNCKSPKEAHEDMKNPRLFQRLATRRMVRDSMSAKDFRTKGDEIIQGIYEVGQEVTLNEVEELYKEV